MVGICSSMGTSHEREVVEICNSILMVVGICNSMVVVVTCIRMEEMKKEMEVVGICNSILVVVVTCIHMKKEEETCGHEEARVEICNDRLVGKAKGFWSSGDMA